jgi:hypothetical protein
VYLNNPHHEAEGLAGYCLARFLVRHSEPAEAENLFVVVSSEFADVPYGRKTLGQAAKGDLFELQNLAVGKVAPDIEGEDVDGVAFKLSDYRGMVLMLDFWGHW